MDDTPANIDVLRKTLEPEGYNIAIALNGELAIKNASIFKPDLILLDVMMPGINGFETCRRLKINEQTSQIPIIFITAKTDSEDILEGFNAGGADYITKPFRREEVLARTKAHLDLRSLMKQKDSLIIELEKVNFQLEHMSRTDPLTGLSNRRDLLQKLSQEEARFKRGQKPFTIILTDIDHFKKVNDTYGHDAGDQVLIKVAQLLKGMIREQDIVSRWGGEEFLVLIPETNLEGGIKLAEKCRTRIQSETIHHNQQEIKVTMSFGVSTFKTGQALEECIKMADDLLYIAKRTTRNRVVSEHDKESNVT